ncbi:NAD(P)/FAD-dependent oxidoreductase [Corallococcus sp. M34]|uniref:NAD(P)/FAD-dependent oxidoreductase n=1 Tax=Citreicoccus inhibens TaxID=2849499 RepID=UPI001C216D57|nr:NAD(P)/FAD-dependent oxidoreductase [Citreicoccus inhibens]MBU8899376.1 NAD(P)/FAD-dependent oxidoreductase [Citreicoccus inhibens]
MLILGGGFAGMYAALHLEKRLARRDDVEVMLVSHDNYFLFTPMLHEVAASDVDPAAIVVALRKVLPHVAFVEGDATRIDLGAREVRVSHGEQGGHDHVLAYDDLVMAMGSETNFFGQEGAKRHALTMKTLGDAVLLRNHLIDRLEEADTACITRGDRDRGVTFVVVGGGFAGVETAGAVNDFIRGALPYYPRIQPADVRVVLVHGGAEVLPELGAGLGAYARNKLSRNGVEVLTHTRVVEVDGQSVTLSDGSRRATRTVVWVAGVTPTPLLEDLPCEKHQGRLRVTERLEVPGHPGVWAVGDCASVPDVTRGGHPTPPTAQHALRQGVAVARNVEAAYQGKPPRVFRYRMVGQLAAIGRRSGVARILGLKFSGFVAWFLWRGVYWWKLPRVEKKVRVALDWALDLFFHKDIVQLIGARELERFPLPVRELVLP